MLRGGFHPAPDDAVPALPDGKPTGTVVLAGNAGSAMWEAFSSAARDPGESAPLDAWLGPQLRTLATQVDAHLILPSEGPPPYPPFQAWAMRAEPVQRSPLGILIHPVYGLWHVYRAAFCFAERLPVLARDDIPSPCTTCVAKPCLQVCPADAFTPDRFEAQRCVEHVAGSQGSACREGGCLARRACPVGRDYTYPPAAQAFHTAALLRWGAEEF